MMQALSRSSPVWVRIAVSATVIALYYTSFPWAYALLGADFVDLGEATEFTPEVMEGECSA